VIVDASFVIDVVADPGPRGDAARKALGARPAGEQLIAPGPFAVEVMSGVRAAANRPKHPLDADGIERSFRRAESLGIAIEATPWADVHRAWALAQASLRYADAIYVAAAERHETALLTTDMRIARSGAPLKCKILTVVPGEDYDTARHIRPGGDR
jgi:predicted nucleic acid-binding protein